MSKHKWLSDEQVQTLNERHGWFKHGDAQSDVSREFANDAVEAHERLRSAAPDLLEALKGLLDDVQGLMSESEGVVGLHRNGDVADWASLDEGGRFERLSNMSAAIAAIAKATAP